MRGAGLPPGSGPRGDAGPGGEAQGCEHLVLRVPGWSAGEAGAGLQGPAWSWSCRQSLPDSSASWGPVPPQVLPERSVLALFSPDLPGPPGASSRRGQCVVASESPPAETLLSATEVRTGVPLPVPCVRVPCSVPRPPHPRVSCMLLLVCRDLPPPLEPPLTDPAAEEAALAGGAAAAGVLSCPKAFASAGLGFRGCCPRGLPQGWS